MNKFTLGPAALVLGLFLALLALFGAIRNQPNALHRLFLMMRSSGSEQVTTDPTARPRPPERSGVAQSTQDTQGNRSGNTTQGRPSAPTPAAQERRNQAPAPPPPEPLAAADRQELARDIQTAENNAGLIEGTCRAGSWNDRGGRYWNARGPIPRTNQIAKAVNRRIASESVDPQTQANWARIVREVQRANEQQDPEPGDLRSQVRALASIRERLVSGQQVTRSDQRTVQKTLAATTAALQQLRDGAADLERLWADIQGAGLVPTSADL